MTKPPPKRHATSGTRKGNGAGWGGPAKKAGTDAPMRAPFEAGNDAAKGYHDMSKSDRLAAVDERKWMIGMGLIPNVQPVEMTALNSYEERHIGKAIARTVSLDPCADLTHDQLDALLAAAERADGLGVGGAAAFGEAAAPIGKPH